MLFPSNPELILWLEITPCLKRTVCLSLQNIPHLFMMQGFLSRRCSTAWGKTWNLLLIKSIVSSCSHLLSRYATKKQRPPYRLSMAQPVKIEFRVSLIFIGSIHYFIATTSVLHYIYIHISPQLNILFPSYFNGFAQKGSCSFHCCLMCLSYCQTSVTWCDHWPSSSISASAISAWN